MWPILTVRVALSVGLSVCHTSGPCRTAAPIELPFGLRTSVGPGNHVLDGGQIPHGKGQIRNTRSALRLYRHCNVQQQVSTLRPDRNVQIIGRVQLASDFGKRLRAAISCHLTQTSKESAQLKINITSLTDVNKNTSADDKLLCQSDCHYSLLLFCSCTTYIIK